MWIEDSRDQYLRNHHEKRSKAFSTCVTLEHRTNTEYLRQSVNVYGRGMKVTEIPQRNQVEARNGRESTPQKSSHKP